jgi:hypothetical protein
MTKKSPRRRPSKRSETASKPTAAGREPYRVRLPGFVSDEEIGLGDAVKRMTTAAGFRTCGGCERRAAALNRWITFSGWSRR